MSQEHGMLRCLLISLDYYQLMVFLTSISTSTTHPPLALAFEPLGLSVRGLTPNKTSYLNLLPRIPLQPFYLDAR